MNGDGFDDIVTCGTANDRGSVDGLLGNGDGTFQQHPTQSPVGNDPKAIVVGDFNIDSHLDVATADSGTNGISVLLGNGDGTFEHRQRFAVERMSPSALTSADLDHDGILDLVVAVPGGFVALLGDGSGGFLLSIPSTQFLPVVGLRQAMWMVTEMWMWLWALKVDGTSVSVKGHEPSAERSQLSQQ